MHLLQWLADVCFVFAGCVAGYAFARWLRLPVWKLHAYGGGQPIPFRGTKQDAITYCNKTFGQVTCVDECCGFIFYKPFGWKPSGV